MLSLCTPLPSSEKAATRGAGGSLGFCVRGRFVVVLVVPGVAGLQHFQVDVAPVAENDAHRAPVSVGVLNLHDDVAPRDKPGEKLARSLAERLAFFGRVDSVKADFVLGVGDASYYDRIDKLEKCDESDLKEKAYLFPVHGRLFQRDRQPVQHLYGK